MTRLELSIAWRYLRSRRDSKLFSLISVIAIVVFIGVEGALFKTKDAALNYANMLARTAGLRSPHVTVLGDA